MKKLIALILILSLVLVGCTVPDSDPTASSSPDLQQGAPTEGTSPQTDPTDAQEGTRPGPATSDPTSTNPSVPDSTENGTEGTKPAWPTEGTTPTEPKSTSPQATEKPTTPTTPPEETRPTTPPETTPTNPPETTPTNPPETTPTNPPETTPTQPPETKPEETEPPTTTLPTEPAGCNHEWKCIHHPEEGHWRAGIICDCGWTVYGEPGELTALWNAHSASFPPAESLFDHGGFGSMDEWIVDKPAYDEWVCRHCGEPKP